MVLRGKNNFSRIKGNSIHMNKLFGIKIQKSAQIEIVNNKIWQNLGQGVLLTNDSSSFINSNVIQKNLKAQVAFGGKTKYVVV